MKIVNLTPVFIFSVMIHLFVYGSLLFPDLVTALTGKLHKYLPVTLSGFKRLRLKGYDYPAIIEEPGSKVEGFLIENVDEKAMQILTFFEGDEYEKQQVLVDGAKRKINAFTFVWAGNNSLLESTDWDKNEFKDKSLKCYLEEIVPETLIAFRSQNL